MKRTKADKLPIGEPVVAVEDTIDITVGGAESFDANSRRGWREWRAMIAASVVRPGVPDVELRRMRYTRHEE